MKWQVTQTTDLIHVGIFTAASLGYAKAGLPQCILGLHPGNVLQDIPVGEKSDYGSDFWESVLQSQWQLPDNGL